MRKSSQRCYCAFCRTERVVYLKKHITWIDASLIALGSGLTMVALWQDLHPSGLLFFTLALIATELVVNIRWRLSINCAKCGFDPVLYKKDPERAAQKVKAYMEERSADPFWALSPPKLPPFIKKKDAGSGSRLNTRG